jgi:hypothetical protein
MMMDDMTPKEEKLYQAETHIRWNMLEPLATMFTADPVVKREWESLNYPVVQPLKGVKGWMVMVPIDRINFKPLKRRTQVVAAVESVKVA